MKYSRKILTAIAFIAAVAVFCIGCLYFTPGPVVRLNNLVYDAWMRHVEKPKADPAPAIVDIDDKSLEKLGQWPWPRTLLADLIDRILDSGALAIGMDILLTEPDRTSPASLKKYLEERHGLAVTIDGVPPELLDNDQYFSEAIKGKPVVLAAFADFSGGRMPGKLPKAIGTAGSTPPGALSPRESVARAQGMLAPLEKFSDAAPVGLINSTIYEDGVLRSVPLLTQVGDNYYAALALRTLMAAMERNTLLLRSDIGWLEELKAGNVEIPVEMDGSFRPFFMGGPGTYPYFSAADILSGRIGKDELDGRIIFLGSSAQGLLDMRSTPLAASIPGVEVHANLVDNMLSGRHVSMPPHAQNFQLLFIVLSAALAYAMFSFLPAIQYVFGAIILVAACIWASWLQFENGLFISPVYAIMAALLMGALIIPLRFWHEQRAKRQIKTAFAHYVAPEVVNRIAASGTKALTGQSREISVLFTDVRGFTTISENMRPDELVRMLNSYFTPMTACVIAREGTLDKFIGDALMAFWNAPLDVENHQEKAVLAALDMQKKLAELRPEFMREFGATIKIGAGIHCGIAQVGNMGSNDLLNYTCIGDNVNLASRLESLSKRYGAGIVASADVVNKCGGLRFRQLDRITVKGSSRPLDIYTPLANEPDEAFEEAWSSALREYFNGDFNSARAMFAKLQMQHGQNVAIGLFIERCSCLLANPPEAWNGVWAYDSK